MIEIDVLYADLSRQRVPYNQKAALTQSGVLAVVVTTDEEVGKLKNLKVSYGFDKYALCEFETEGQIWIEIYSWDDGDFVWKRLTNSHDIDGRKEVPIPFACMHMIFDGQSVSDATWKEALEIIETDML